MSAVIEGNDSRRGTLIAVKTEQRTSDMVLLTGVGRWDNGKRRTMPVYVNRRHVTHVIGGRYVTVHFTGEQSIEVTESVECVVEALA